MCQGHVVACTGRASGALREQWGRTDTSSSHPRIQPPVGEVKQAVEQAKRLRLWMRFLLEIHRGRGGACSRLPSRTPGVPRVGWGQGGMPGTYAAKGPRGRWRPLPADPGGGVHFPAPAPWGRGPSRARCAGCALGQGAAVCTLGLPTLAPRTCRRWPRETPQLQQGLVGSLSPCCCAACMRFHPVPQPCRRGLPANAFLLLRACLDFFIFINFA